MDRAFFFLPFSALIFFWPCSSWAIHLSVRHRRWSLSIFHFSSETCSFQGRMMSYLCQWLLQSLLSHFTLWDSSTSQASRDFTLPVNLLRRACLRPAAHNSRSCCVRVTWLFCQPGNSHGLMISLQVLVVLLLILELLTWQQIRAVLSVPVHGINSSYLGIFIWAGTWLSRAVFCISFSRQMSCTATCERVSAEKGWMSWHCQVIRHKIPVWCTQGASVLHRCPLSPSEVFPGRWPGLRCSCWNNSSPWWPCMTPGKDTQSPGGWLCPAGAVLGAPGSLLTVCLALCSGLLLQCVWKHDVILKLELFYQNQHKNKLG